jgi:hypothetical protein
MGYWKGEGRMERREEGRGQDRRFIIGIGSPYYGGLEVPHSALCKLFNSETW